MNGDVFANTTSFTHAIPSNATVCWRPKDDVNTASLNNFVGSYVMDVTQGSVTANSEEVLLAGEQFPDGNYNEGDILTTHTLPVMTSTCTLLNMDRFLYYEDSSDNYEWADHDGEYSTYVHINNPSSSVAAKVKLTFYDTSGSKYSLTDHDTGDNYTKTVTINPHEMIDFTPGTYGINGTSSVPAIGSLTLDVIQGSVVANYDKIYVKEYGTRTFLRSVGGNFHMLVNQP